VPGNSSLGRKEFFPGEPTGRVPALGSEKFAKELLPRGCASRKRLGGVFPSAGPPPLTRYAPSHDLKKP